jgi:hypothetical protein
VLSPTVRLLGSIHWCPKARARLRAPVARPGQPDELELLELPEPDASDIMVLKSL